MLNSLEKNIFKNDISFYRERKSMRLNKVSNTCFPLCLGLTHTSDESSSVICTHSALSSAESVVNELLL